VDASKHSLTIIDMISVPVMGICIWSYTGYKIPGSPVISKIGWLVGYGFLLYFINIAISYYLNCLHSILNGVARAVAPFLIGFAVIQFVILQDVDFVSHNRLIALLLTILLCWYSVRGYRVSEYVVQKDSLLKEDELRKMIPIFPPRSFSDLWRYHLFLFFLLVGIPYIARVYWGQL